MTEKEDHFFSAFSERTGRRLSLAVWIGLVTGALAGILLLLMSIASGPR